MERQMKHGMRTLRIILMLCVLICAIGILKDHAYAAILETDVAVPAAGNIFIEIEGSYAGDTQAALDRINEIRREACEEGVINPDTNQPLTMYDYTPVKWSAGLEYIARIRAAESSLTMDHTRTNGARCFAISSPDGIKGNFENLAWNWSSSIVSGIEQWYEEKADWVNKTGAVTGHYTSMIRPSVTYIGVASFKTRQARYPNTVASQYTSSSSLGSVDETMGTSITDCTQLLEVPSSWIEKLSLSENLEKGKTERVYGVHTNHKYGLYQHTWQTSNPAVIAVDESGTVTAKEVGSAVITAVDANGNTTASATVNVTAPKQEEKEDEKEKEETPKQPLSASKVSLSFRVATYTGSAIKPNVTVRSMSEGKDYKVTYSNNVNVGTARVKIEGIGNANGSVLMSFTIKAKRLKDLPVDIRYDKAASKANVSIAGLTEGTDYTVSTSNPRFNQVDIKVTGKGNYTGTVTQSFTLDAKPLEPFSFSLAYTSTTYTGEEKKPAVKTSLKTSDYTVSYENNINAGTATVSIKGKGAYTCSAYLSFIIKPKVLQRSMFDVKIDGSAVTVSGNGLTEKKGFRSVHRRK